MEKGSETITELDMIARAGNVKGSGLVADRPKEFIPKEGGIEYEDDGLIDAIKESAKLIWEEKQK